MLRATRGRTAITASPTGILIEKRGVWRARTTQIPAGNIVALDYSSIGSLLDSAVRSAEREAMRAGNAVSGFSTGLRDTRLFAVVKTLLPSKGIIVKSRRGFSSLEKASLRRSSDTCISSSRARLPTFDEHLMPRKELLEARGGIEPPNKVLQTIMLLEQPLSYHEAIINKWSFGPVLVRSSARVRQMALDSLVAFGVGADRRSNG